jgi:hypothetical protein
MKTEKKNRRNTDCFGKIALILNMLSRGGCVDVYSDKRNEKSAS